MDIGALKDILVSYLGFSCLLLKLKSNLTMYVSPFDGFIFQILNFMTLCEKKDFKLKKCLFLCESCNIFLIEQCKVSQVSRNHALSHHICYEFICIHSYLP